MPERIKFLQHEQSERIKSFTNCSLLFFRLLIIVDWILAPLRCVFKCFKNWSVDFRFHRFKGLWLAYCIGNKAINPSIKLISSSCDWPLWSIETKFVLSNVEVTEHYDCSNQSDISRFLVSQINFSCSSFHDIVDIVNNKHQKWSNIWKVRIRYTLVGIKNDVKSATSHTEIMILRSLEIDLTIVFDFQDVFSCLRIFSILKAIPRHWSR